jgi:hypothetical protein
MKYLTVVFLVLFSLHKGASQTFELGGFVGGANVIGDVGSTTYVNPNTLAFGGIFKWNRSERHSFRFSAILAKAEGNDADSKESRRKQRGYSFQNNIKEFSAGLEYTFWEFNLNSGAPTSAPYLYTGITYFLYKASYVSGSGVYTEYDQAGAFAIPMVLGYKATLSTKLIGAFEIGARYSFTDDIDASNPVLGYQDTEDLKFGNQNNNDWYVFTGITFSFTFGREPCYCNF